MRLFFLGLVAVSALAGCKHTPPPALPDLPPPEYEAPRGYEFKAKGAAPAEGPAAPAPVKPAGSAAPAPEKAAPRR